jgi:hypothetical protein
VVEVGRVRGRKAAAGLAIAAWFLGLVSSFAAAADEVACWRVAGGQELSVAGLGRVVFDALTTDRARDAASLTGGVCLTLAAVDGELRTERLELTGLTGDLALAALDVALSLPGWVLTAGELTSDGARATLRRVAMRGAEAVALADEVVIDLASGEVVAHGLRLATETVWMDAERGTFDGHTVWAERALLTTCDCPPEESPLRLEAVAVRLDLAETRIRLDGAVLGVQQLRVELPDPLELDAAAIADLALPVTLGADPEGIRGLVLRGVEREVAAGVRFAWDIASGEGDRSPDGAWRVTGAADGASFSVVAGSEGLQTAWRMRRPLGGGFGVDVAQRLEAGAGPERVRDQSATVDWRGSLDRPGRTWTRLEFSVGATGALSAQSLGGVEIVGTRWGVEGRARAVAADRGFGLFVTEVTAGATRYPSQGTDQAWIAVAPVWTLRTGPWVLQLGHVARWVAGASPFGVRLDRRVPTQRTDASLAVTTAIADGWSLTGSTALRLDWGADAARPGRIRGVERLQVRFDLTGPAWGGRWAIGATGDLAGWVDPRPRRAAEASFGASWSGRGLELGTRATLLGEATGTTWTEAAVFGSWTIESGDWAWRPYLAFDLAALGRGGAGWWSGHGLDLAWTSCCGILELGYRHDDALGTRLRGGFRLETHPLELQRLADATDPQGRVPTPVTTP